VTGNLYFVPSDYSNYDEQAELMHHRDGSISRVPHAEALLEGRIWDLFHHGNGTIDSGNWIKAMIQEYYYFQVRSNYGLLLQKKDDGKFERIGFRRHRTFWVFTDETEFFEKPALDSRAILTTMKIITIV
jgi:hypothetical protein